jgi:DNA-binding transcriptional LysR family regulator
MVKLTFEGESLFNLAAPVIEEFENIGDEFEKARGTLRGEVRIVSFGAMLSNVLPGLLVEFRRKHPECEIFLLTGAGNDIQSMVLSGTVDFGIGSMDNLLKGFWVSKRGGVNDILITPRDHRFVRRKQLSVRDLANAALVSTNRASHTGEQLLKELKKYNPNQK